MKFFSNYKIIFYSINISLIILYLFPGSIFGCIFLDNCRTQPQITPDFVKIIDSKVIFIEAKGRFWDYAEFSKYIHIRKALPEGYELVFLFQKPFAPMPGAKIRKNGTKRTHAEWAETNNFTWYSEETLPKEWITDEL